ncbi:MAG: LPS export ABC transporter permease LptG [Deltaproteobacteria bacterium]|nr:MAG: LPS export ABC transporter permease LptG [Deltaproteobacteria bacterium]
MSKLSRYLFCEFFKFFGICLCIFLSIYLIIHFFARIDDFLESGVPKEVMLSYFLFKIPYMLVQMLPPSVLIAVVILFTIMKNNNEITALKASGINVNQLLQPIVFMSVFLAALLFLLSEVVVPFTSSRCNDIWRTKVRKRRTQSFYGRSHIWYKSKNAIYWFGKFDSNGTIAHDVSIYYFSSDFRLVRRIDARLAVWKNGSWHLKDGVELKLKKGEGYVSKGFQQLTISLPETPQTFTQVERKPEELNYWQLRRFAERVQEEGYDATRYFVDLNIKLAFPFIVVVMVLIGFPISMKVEKGGGPMAVSLGVALCFLYVFLLGVTRAIGFSGLLPPFLSAWLANIVFAIFGIYLITLVPR